MTPALKKITPPIDDDRALRNDARDMYWAGYRISHIARLLEIDAQKIYAWARSERWDDATPLTRVNSALESRLAILIKKELKEGHDYKEIDLLTRQFERTARVEKYQQSGSEIVLNPTLEKRYENQRGKKRETAKNPFTDEQVQALNEAFDAGLFGYQRAWFEAGKTERIRAILKSRQIGATWYFAREALIDAVNTGRNQIFLSASKAQAHVFKSYIREFAQNASGIELKGDPIVLPNDAHLYFLGTSSKTAQSYHGNLYFDEYFWVHKFQELRKVASGMAIHKKWRQTYFSTPSSINHEAYPFWMGDLFNAKRRGDQKVVIDVGHDALAKGARGPDGIWRHIVTVEDAEAGGCDLFDVAQLRLEYGEDEYQNLLMCQFIDDSQSVFPMSELQLCMVDSWTAWDDYQPFADRPLGGREVWVGYDPASTGDSAGLVVVAPPAIDGGKFRVLEKFRFYGLDFSAQADEIRKITTRYNVGYIGIDATGVGNAVYQLVRNFYPTADAIRYSVEVKSRMVLKAKDVVVKRRLEFDTGWTDLAQSLLSIRKTLTASGNQITYESGRSQATHHADIGWALLHALAHEPLEGNVMSNSGFVAFTE